MAHLRQCRRCGKFYRSYSRESQYCDNCKRPNGSGYKIKNEVKSGEERKLQTLQLRVL